MKFERNASYLDVDSAEFVEGSQWLTPGSTFYPPMNVPVTLKKDVTFQCRYVGGGVSYWKLKAGVKIKRIRLGDPQNPSVWETV